MSGQPGEGPVVDGDDAFGVRLRVLDVDLASDVDHGATDRDRARGHVDVVPAQTADLAPPGAEGGGESNEHADLQRMGVGQLEQPPRVRRCRWPDRSASSARQGDVASGARRQPPPLDRLTHRPAEDRVELADGRRSQAVTFEAQVIGIEVGGSRPRGPRRV